MRVGCNGMLLWGLEIEESTPRDRRIEPLLFRPLFSPNSSTRSGLLRSAKVVVQLRSNGAEGVPVSDGPGDLLKPTGHYFQVGAEESLQRVFRLLAAHIRTSPADRAVIGTIFM